MADDFAIAPSTVQKWVPVVVSAMASTLPQYFIRFPRDEELNRVIADFESMCRLPQVAGAIDGTYIKIHCPTCDFSDRYYCYKGYYSVMLLACVDAVGRFTFIDVGRPGCVGDAAAWRNCHLQPAIQSRTVLPESKDRDINGTIVQPYLLGDAAFPLTPYVIKGYDTPTGRAQEDFNRAICRGRRVVECAFGRLKNRFRIMKSTILNEPKYLAKVITACCALHNYCETFKLQERMMGLDEWDNDAWETDRFMTAQPGGQSNNTAAGEDIRECLKDFLQDRLNYQY